VYEQLATLQRF